MTNLLWLCKNSHCPIVVVIIKLYLFLDSNVKSALEGFELMAYSSECLKQRELAEEDLTRLWIDRNSQAYVLPCLSIRSGLDLFLSVSKRI